VTIIYSSKELRERDPHDFYPTPIELCRAALDLIPESRSSIFVLDPGAGKGPWGQVIKEINPYSHLTGVELQDDPKPDAYDFWYNNQDFLDFNLRLIDKYDLIIGNPPYKLAEEFIKQSYGMLSNGGKMLFLLRLAFLESKARYFGIWSTIRPSKVWICSRRPSFTGDRKTDATAYAIYEWVKAPYSGTAMDWLYWEYDDEELNEDDDGQDNGKANKKSKRASNKTSTE
jgi:hypothetical protein